MRILPNTSDWNVAVWSAPAELGQEQHTALTSGAEHLLWVGSAEMRMGAAYPRPLVSGDVADLTDPRTRHRGAAGADEVEVCHWR